MAGSWIDPSSPVVGRLLVALGAASLASSRDLGAVKEAVADLRSRFLGWIADPALPWHEVAEAFIAHEASMTKLRNVVGWLMMADAWDDERRESLFAEAGLEILRRFAKRRDLGYVDAHGSFDSWLFTVWKNAARHANRKLQQRAGKVVLVDPRRLDLESSSRDDPAEDEAMLTIQEVHAVIARLPAGNLRNVMLDWASGLSAVDSARQRRVTQSWVSKLRKRGVAHIRKRLGVTPPTARG